MNKNQATKMIAEGLRETYIKMDALENLTGFGIYDYLDGLYEIETVLLSLLDVPPWECDEDIVSDFLHGKIEYEEMLAKVDEARASFDPEEYDDYVRDYERVYGNHPNGGASND